MADRSRVIPDERGMADMLRGMQRDIAELKRARSRGAMSFPLPFQLGDWRFEQVAGGLRAINVVTDVLFSSGGAPGPPGTNGLPGMDGTNGIDGAPGATGPRGLSLLHGTTSPGSGVGIAGEFYIDTVTMTLWGPKDATLGWTGGGIPLTADPYHGKGYVGWQTAKIVGTVHPAYPPSLTVVNFNPGSIGFPTSPAGTEGGIVFIPIQLPWQATIDQIIFQTTAGATAAGATARLGLYAASVASGLPTGTPTTLGTVSITTPIGNKTVTIASPATIPVDTPMWIALQFSSTTGFSVVGSAIAPVGRASAAAYNIGSPTTHGTILSKFNADVGGYAAGLPTNPTFTLATDVRATSGTPSILFRISA